MNKMFQGMREYEGLKKHMASKNYPIALYGFNENAFVLKAIALAEDVGTQLILCETETEAKNLLDKIKPLYPGVGLYLTPEINHFDEHSHSRQLEIERLESLYLARTVPNFILIAPITASMVNLSPPSFYEEKTLELQRGEDYDLSVLINDLISLGYERMDIVEAKGQFAVKGGIIDVYPLLSESPLRLDFFGDELYELKRFHIETQLSYENLESYKLIPAREGLVDGFSYQQALEYLGKKASSSKDANLKKAYRSYEDGLESGSFMGYPLKYLPFVEGGVHSFFDYVKPFHILIRGFTRQITVLENHWAELFSRMKEDILEKRLLPEQASMYMPFEEALASLLKSKLLLFNSLKTSIKHVSPRSIVDYHFMDLSNYYGDLSPLSYDLKRWGEASYRIIFSVANENEKTSILKFLDEEGLSYTQLQDEKSFDGSYRAGIYLIESLVLGGFINDSFRLALLTPSELFGKKLIKKRKLSEKTKKIKAFSEIEQGDYVVHENYGIGRYLGIVLKEIDGEKKDMVKIEYAGNSLLFLPVERLDSLHKYMGKEAEKVSLNSLSSTKWQRQKERAKKAVDEIASELVELYNARKNSEGHAYPPDDVWQREFEEAFPYVETYGQLNAVKEIKEDMMKAYPMERLLCGDVGYGKTEVALRAIFKAITNGKQACVLVPTTILAEQHYISMSHRLSDYPLEVGVLSRFKTKKEQKEVLEKLKTGRLDLLIGTHRILSKDVVFKDLGLLVVDEEQRFGVAHKEKIKMLKLNVDSLSMSATPIPRTLNMSLIGVKDLSVIEDAPEDRFPIQTYVLEDDDAVLKSAIMREVSRGGQVYFVHNRIEDIYSVSERVAKLCPEVRLQVAHGRLDANTLEGIILDFMQGDYDVLVTTTIIETGVDIPNVNTIIIDECDKFGLSQLYQLRGRVGRSNRLAYAYLTYRKNKVLSELAEKRLQAIKEFSSLGSGFKLSMRDLEIRGSGNIFGHAQSGHIEAIGYEMYLKLLEEAVSDLKGGPKRRAYDCKADFAYPAYISDDYIEDYRFKLEIYKLISSISTMKEREEAVGEIKDRFGPLPLETLNLSYISLIRKMAEGLGFDHVLQEGNKVKLSFSSAMDLDLRLIYDILDRCSHLEVNFVADQKPYYRLDFDREAESYEVFEGLIDFLNIFEEIYKKNEED